jgi:hypothetical protein
MKTDRLADLYADPGPFASVYLDVSRDMENGDRIVELAARSAGESLAEQGASQDVVEAVRGRLTESTHEGAPVSRLVIATERGILLDELAHSRTPQPTAVWAALPDLAGWLTAADSVVPFVLARVDHEGGQVETYRSGGWSPEEEQEVGSPDVHEHKFGGGGWSHLRFQRVSENAWIRNAEAVAEEIKRQLTRDIGLVLLAGDVRSRQEVQEALGEIRAEVVQIDGGSPHVDGGDEALQEAVRNVLAGRVTSAKLAEVHELQARLGRDDSVAIGVRDVADALVRGQVDRLLIDPASAREFSVEPARHPGLAFGAVEPPASIPADQALIAAAVLTAAEVVITRASTLGGAPVAGLLRWDQTSEGTRA